MLVAGKLAGRPKVLASPNRNFTFFPICGLKTAGNAGSNWMCCHVDGGTASTRSSASNVRPPWQRTRRRRRRCSRFVSTGVCKWTRDRRDRFEQPQRQRLVAADAVKSFVLGPIFLEAAPFDVCGRSEKTFLRRRHAAVGNEFRFEGESRQRLETLVDRAMRPSTSRLAPGLWGSSTARRGRSAGLLRSGASSISSIC